jgi:phospholipase D1/2
MQIFICGWWLCPELYMRRPFHTHASSKLDSLLEAKAREGVQVNLYFEQSGTLILYVFLILIFINFFYFLALKHILINTNENYAIMFLQIYILLYKEVALALKINSVYSKRKLLGIHENVRVLRYPDHFSSGVYLWYALNLQSYLGICLLLRKSHGIS